MIRTEQHRVRERATYMVPRIAFPWVSLRYLGQRLPEVWASRHMEGGSQDFVQHGPYVQAQLKTQQLSPLEEERKNRLHWIY